MTTNKNKNGIITYSNFKKILWCTYVQSDFPGFLAVLFCECSGAISLSATNICPRIILGWHQFRYLLWQLILVLLSLLLTDPAPDGHDYSDLVLTTIHLTNFTFAICRDVIRNSAHCCVRTIFETRCTWQEFNTSGIQLESSICLRQSRYLWFRFCLKRFQRTYVLYWNCLYSNCTVHSYDVFHYAVLYWFLYLIV